MTPSTSIAELQLKPEDIRDCFNSQPFGFEHSLAGLDIMRFDNLTALAEKYVGHERDYYLAQGAQAPGTTFTSVPTISCLPHEAMERLTEGSYRVLLKRPELHDPLFRDLLEDLFAQIAGEVEGLRREDLVRLEGGLLITSAATTTPFHFDPEINFFAQIEGDKLYHVYAPSVVAEPELEKFFSMGRLMIAQIDLAGRDPAREFVFALKPGLGFHQPENAPHWVQTTASRSISYSFVFETGETRARSRARAANHYLRRLSLHPSRPGTHPAFDTMKSGAMRLVLPMRRALSDVARARRSQA